MGRSKMLGSIFLVVLCICFFSLPVYSGEYPWDNQEGGNGDGVGSDGLDTIIVTEGTGLIPLRTAVDPGNGSQGLLFYISYRFTTWYFESIMSERNLRVIETKETAFDYRGVYRSKKLME